MSHKKSKMSSNLSISGLLLACITINLVSAHPLSRRERQTLSRELGTGLTGTGTSFSSLHDQYGSGYYPQQQTMFEGQRAYDPEYSGIGITTIGNGGYKNRMGFNGIGVEYDPPLTTPLYGGYQDTMIDNGLNGRMNWRGFGAGKNPYTYGGSYGTKGGYDGIKGGHGRGYGSY